MHVIENDFIKLTLNSTGAEKMSVIGKKSGTEFLWNGDPAYWSGRAPVLFPIVGRLVNGLCRINGNEYRMDCHGFAKDSEFNAVKKREDNIIFELVSDKATKTQYPYDFIFDIAYALNSSEISVTYEIKNSGANDMAFAVGAHPGFCCPFGPDEDFNDYYLEFNKKETAETLFVRLDFYFGHETVPFLNDENIINLDHNLFKNDALVFKNLKSKTVCLKSRKNEKYVKMDFDGFAYLGVWTRVGAPYVCIEPWTSLGDYYDFKGELREKPGMVTLKPNGSYSVCHKIYIYD